jgi:DNA-binding LacI/PurR family transcriptional regulator
VAKGVARKLQPLGYQVVISDTEEDGEVERRQVDVLINRKVDGLIIVSAQRSGPAVPGLASRVASAIAGGWDL